MIFPLKVYFDLSMRSFTDVKYDEIIFSVASVVDHLEIVIFYTAVTAE